MSRSRNHERSRHKADDRSHEQVQREHVIMNTLSREAVESATMLGTEGTIHPCLNLCFHEGCQTFHIVRLRETAHAQIYKH